MREMQESPANWYPYDVSGTLEILNAYVLDVESVAEKIISEFNEGPEKIIVKVENSEDPDRIVMVHKGLDDVTWDLPSIFLEYFPNLQRRSALITVYSTFEHELNKLCDIFRRVDGYKVSVKDLAGAGIERAKSYLQKVALLDLSEANQIWQEIRNIQNIRNLVVHADGKLLQDDKGPIRQHIDACEQLSYTTEVILHAGYVKHVLSVIDSYLKTIDAAIKRRGH